MNESKRFFVKVYSNNEPFFFDEKQEYVEERYTCEDVRNLHPMEYWQVADLLNEQQATISALKDIFKDIIAYSEWDSEKPYCSLGITVDKKTYYEIRKILNE